MKRVTSKVNDVNKGFINMPTGFLPELVINLYRTGAIKKVINNNGDMKIQENKRSFIVEKVVINEGINL